MIPALLLQISLIIILVRVIYVLVNLFKRSQKPWFEILFYLSIAIVVFDYYLRNFHHLL